MRGSKKFCQMRPNFDNVFFFLFNEERKDLNITIRGHHRPASETPLNGVSLAGDDVPTFNAGLVAL